MAKSENTEEFLKRVDAETAIFETGGHLITGHGNAVSEAIRDFINKNNVILFVHGGPGLCNRHEIMAQDDLAKNFILVTWDQRGTGGSYITDQPYLTNDQLVEDAHELILWLTKEFKQK